MLQVRREPVEQNAPPPARRLESLDADCQDRASESEQPQPENHGEAFHCVTSFRDVKLSPGSPAETASSSGLGGAFCFQKAAANHSPNISE